MKYLKEFTEDTGVKKPMTRTMEAYETFYMAYYEWLEQQLVNKNDLLQRISISFIQQLIDKYEDKIKCIENLQKQPKDRNYPRWQEERLNARLYERKTFLEDLKSLLNEC